MKLSRLFSGLPRDKADTLLLLGAVSLVLVPHTQHLPFWISLVTGSTLVWRTVLTLRGLRMPPLLLLLAVALASMAGIFREYHSFLGRDTGVAMLTLLLAFKTLEMHARRDLFVVIYLSLFVVLTNFFYSQSLLTGALMLVTTTLILSAQLSFQYAETLPPLRTRLAFAARTVALALPIAALLFIVFPRIQGPLWGRPGEGAGSSGLSETMSPGKISQLALSDDVAFRVKFDGAPPPMSRMYWRGIVLGLYDGTTWRRYNNPEQNGHVTVELLGRPVSYRVTMEPLNSRWLFALDLPERLHQNSQLQIGVTPELEMHSTNAIDQRVRYEVLSYPDYKLQADEQATQLRAWLQLPGRMNPSALNVGATLRQMPDPLQRAQAVLKFFRTEPFRYTLLPPALGTHAVDEFLFTTRAGFCEHYAGAFVFLMRAAGVPARVVTGYQGGEFNPVDAYLTVRQSDAHAWAEIWLAGRGWVRVDPTAAVAPERVERGAAQTLKPPPPLGIQALSGIFDISGDSLLGRLRFEWQALNNGWNQWVLNYTPERQEQFLNALGSALGNGRSLAGAAAIALLAWLLRWQRARAGRDPLLLLYQQLCARLRPYGIQRAPDEAPRALAARVAACSAPPAAKDAAVAFLHLYSDTLYGPGQARATALPLLRDYLKRVR